MKSKTRKLTVAAMLAALQIVLMYIGTVIPAWKLALTALAGILNAAVLIECGVGSSLICFAAVSALSALLLPQKSLAFLYIVLFGYYPLLKSAAERIEKRWLEWAAKLVVFNLAFALCMAALRFGFVSDINLPDVALVVLWLGLNVVFVIYDVGLTQLISLYIHRIHKIIIC